MNAFTGEPEPEDLKLTAILRGYHADGWLFVGEVSDNTDAAGGEIQFHVSDSARTVHGFQACANAVERYLSNVLPRKVRLAAAVEIAKWGKFSVIATAETGPRVIPPRQPSVAELLAA